MAQTQAQLKASAKYHKKLKTIALKFHEEKDADILAWLEKFDNKTEYCRELIRKDMRGA